MNLFNWTEGIPGVILVPPSITFRLPHPNAFPVLHPIAFQVPLACKPLENTGCAFKSVDTETIYPTAVEVTLDTLSDDGVYRKLLKSSGEVEALRIKSLVFHYHTRLLKLLKYFKDNVRALSLTGVGLSPALVDAIREMKNIERFEQFSPCLGVFSEERKAAYFSKDNKVKHLIVDEFSINIVDLSCLNLKTLEIVHQSETNVQRIQNITQCRMEGRNGVRTLKCSSRTCGKSLLLDFDDDYEQHGRVI
jgi:hypothetical protein